jgi:hypothetical protein
MLHGMSLKISFSYFEQELMLLTEVLGEVYSSIAVLLTDEYLISGIIPNGILRCHGDDCSIERVEERKAKLGMCAL